MNDSYAMQRRGSTSFVKKGMDVLRSHSIAKRLQSFRIQTLCVEQGTHYALAGVGAEVEDYGRVFRKYLNRK